MHDADIEMVANVKVDAGYGSAAEHGRKIQSFIKKKV